MNKTAHVINADFAETMAEWLELQTLDVNPELDTRSIAEREAGKVRLAELAKIINEQAGVIARRKM